MRNRRKTLLLTVILLSISVLFYITGSIITDGFYPIGIYIIMGFIVIFAVVVVLEIEFNKGQVFKQREHIKEIKKRIAELEEKKSEYPPTDPLLFSQMTTKTTETEFQLNFRKQQPTFIPILREKVPKITSGEENLCMMIKLNMTTREIAHILNIDIKSVHTARARLKRKLPLEDDISLDDWIRSLG